MRVLGILFMLSLSACNTVSGLGTDIKASSDSVKAWYEQKTADNKDKKN